MFRTVFDVDGDGFVSHADFEGACRKLQIQADSKSIIHAIRALDTDQKGYFDYRSFSKKMQPGMSEKMSLFDQHGSENITLPEVSAPSKQLLEGNIQKTATVTQTVRDVREKFNPDHEHSKYYN